MSITTTQEATGGGDTSATAGGATTGYDSDGRASTPSLEMMSDDDEAR